MSMYSTKSWFETHHSNKIQGLLKEEIALTFKEQMTVATGSIDLGTEDYQYGIEIKSSVADLKSGCGLNQEEFEYPYLLIAERHLIQAVGWLYVCGMERTGVICTTNDNEAYHLSKFAIPRSYSAIGSRDKIARLFQEHNACFCNYKPYAGVERQRVI